MFLSKAKRAAKKAEKEGRAARKGESGKGKKKGKTAATVPAFGNPMYENASDDGEATYRRDALAAMAPPFMPDDYNGDDMYDSPSPSASEPDHDAPFGGYEAAQASDTRMDVGANSSHDEEQTM